MMKNIDELRQHDGLEGTDEPAAEATASAPATDETADKVATE